MSRTKLKDLAKLIDAVKNEIPIEQAFLHDLERSIEMTEAKNAYKPSKTYKPSSMKCIRNMYYQRVGADTDNGDITAAFVGICESGTDRHERIQNAIKEMKNNGIDCEYVNVADFVKQRNLNYLEITGQSGNETKLFHKDLKMSFMCDGILNYKGKYFIFEYKTESGFKWQNRNSVADEHYNQGIAYSIAFGIDDVIFVYENRDNCAKKAFIFTPTESEKYKLISTINKCEKCVENLTVPEKPKDISSKICQYCNYRNLCKKEIGDESNVTGE